MFINTMLETDPGDQSYTKCEVKESLIGYGEYHKRG